MQGKVWHRSSTQYLALKRREIWQERDFWLLGIEILEVPKQRSKFWEAEPTKRHWGTVLGVGISEEAAVVMSGEVVDS